MYFYKLKSINQSVGAFCFYENLYIKLLKSLQPHTFGVILNRNGI
jgi:hypothetical protein